MKTVPLQSGDESDWLRLRLALWPDAPPDEHREGIARVLAEPDRFAQFVARDGQGRAWGFVEASIRNDYVNGTATSPVAFLEGLYVEPGARRRGIARTLVQAIVRWATSKGCSELASDAAARNRTSHAVHRSLGFVETERVVCFNKRLR